MSTIAPNKQLDFYFRAKKQYQNSAKPFTYELNIFSTQPKPKKFMILINKFIDIMKQGMKQEYSNEEQLKQNYWNEMQKYYSDTYEMMYITENSYEKKKNKLKLYFGLLLHNKNIFKTISEMTNQTKLGYMYENPEKKQNQLPQLFEAVEYLKDGQYQIMSQFINEYEKFQEKKKQEEKIKQKMLQKQKKKQDQIQQQKRIKQEQERKQAIKEKEQREKKQKQKKLKEFEQQAEQNKNKKGQKITPVEQIQFIPESYQAHYANSVLNHKQDRKQLKKSQQISPGYTIKLPEQFKGKKYQKNSQVLYEQKFKDQFQVFCFKLKPNFEQNQEKKSHCFQCNCELKQGFYLLGGNQNICEYTGQYYCNEHICQQRISIPWKAIEIFDLRGYTVSKKSFVEIKSYYEKPIIEIKNQDNIVKNFKLLYEFMVLKRQIHLMYDSICDLQLMEPLLKKKMNYCVKPNLFSLKNLYDIYNGHEAPSLQREYDILSKHFYRCERCQKRKGYICPKCKDPVKIFAFELKQTHGCSNCRKLYHRKCLMANKCDCNDED